MGTDAEDHSDSSGRVYLAFNIEGELERIGRKIVERREYTRYEIQRGKRRRARSATLMPSYKQTAKIVTAAKEDTPTFWSHTWLNWQAAIGQLVRAI